MITTQNEDGSVIKDFTDGILIVDLINQLGEKYHFEIAPGEDASGLPSRPSGGLEGIILTCLIFTPQEIENDETNKTE